MFNERFDAGFRRVRVRAYQTPSGLRFAAIFERSTGVTWRAFNTESVFQLDEHEERRAPGATGSSTSVRTGTSTNPARRCGSACSPRSG